MSKLFSKINAFVIVVFIFGVLLGILAGISGIGITIKNLAKNQVPTVPYPSQIPPLEPQSPPPTPPSPPFSTSTNKIEISADGKAILNADTKGVIFAIEDTQKYLKNIGYFLNVFTFTTSTAKYGGDCFLEAALSNSKDRIFFSTGCQSFGDVPLSWVGIYKNEFTPEENRIKFLAPGNGRNFVWSQDDKTIRYKSNMGLGLSPLTETITINSQTGKILERKSEIDTSEWKTYKWPPAGLKYLEFKYPPAWNVKNIYYRTAAQEERGEAPQLVGIKFSPGKEPLGNDFIAIGGVQESCEPSEHHTKCFSISSISNLIYTDSNNPEILKTFDEILSTFKFIDPQK